MKLFQSIIIMCLFITPLICRAGLNQCIVDICGPASENRNIDFYRNEYVSEDHLTKIEKDLFLKATEDNKEAFLALKVKALKEIKSFDFEKYDSISAIDKGILVLLTQGLIPLSTVSYLSNNRIRGDFSELFIDESLGYEEILKILIDAGGENDQAVLQTNYIVGIKKSKFARQVLGMMFSRAPEHALSDHFNTEDNETTLKLYHEKMSQIIDQILKDENENKSQILNFLAQSYKSYLAVGDLSSEEISQLNLLFGLNLFSSRYVKESLGDEKEGFWDRTLEDNILKNTYDLLKNKASSVNIDYSYSTEQLKNDFVETQKVCIEKLEALMPKLPSKNQIVDFVQYYRDVIKGARSFTEKKISYSYGKVVEEKLSRLQIDLPPTREVFGREFPFIMRNKASTNMSLSMVLASLIMSPIEDNAYSFLSDTCSQGSIEGTFYDYSVNSLWHAPSLKVSWTTLKDFNRFKGVIAHEVGHQLYRLYEGEYPEEERFTAAELNNSRELFQCVSQNHEDRDSTRASWTLSGVLESFKVSKYANEDFADQFAAYIEKESSENYACVFLNIKNNEYSNLSFINNDEADHHSSNAFRVLSIEKSKRSVLPESCKKPMDEENVKVHVCVD